MGIALLRHRCWELGCRIVSATPGCLPTMWTCYRKMASHSGLLPSSPEWSILLDALILLDNKNGELDKNEQSIRGRVRHQIKTEIV